jgi:AcrR family transcriptional regulator
MKGRHRGSATPAHGDPVPGQAAGAGLSTRSQILMGAARAFGERGYGATSVEDVLRAAGVSRRTYYRHFRSKEDLFEQLYEAGSLMFLQSMQSAAALGREPLDKIGNCVEAYLRAPQTAGPIFHVMQLEATRPGSRLAARRAHTIEALIDMLDQGLHQHTGRTVDRLLLRGLIAALDNISLYVLTETAGDEAEIQRAKAAMLQLIRATLATA